ncbi:zinc finger protein 62 homolog [Sipha flava]|uniref:Zinc finger protein 62 homolog n=1 Tax=Sipha flava TaxID=143950 RepID=A0A8B8FNU9_9HEMI|nr:zinc finger protein 62 homolog [Sipha flava]
MNVTGMSSTAARASAPSRGRQPAAGPGQRTRPPFLEADRCEVCDVRTLTKIGKWRHVHREHRGDSRLTCHDFACGRRFTNSYARLVHERVHHARSAARGNGRVAYTCELCGTYRHGRNSLAAHVAAAHPAAMSALCGICAVYMGDAESLTLHVRHVHRRDTMATGHGLRCDLCGERCRDPKRLRSHRRVHGVRDMVHREHMLCDLSSVVIW